MRGYSRRQLRAHRLGQVPRADGGGGRASTPPSSTSARGRRSAPEVFGLNDNADITKDLGETNNLLTTVLITQSQASGGGSGKSADEEMLDMSKDILNKLPANFDLELAQKRYPVMYNECKNTVVCQELQRFNKLLSKIRRSLQDLQKALKGLVVMSQDLEALQKSMLDNKLPDLWAKVSYPSLKPLASYVAELLDRLSFFQNWVDDGPPVIFKMPSFFFVQAFMTGCMQNYARKYTIPIDTIDFDFEFIAAADAPKAKPEDGVFTHGLFLEGGRMNTELKLDESEPKVLFAPMTIVQLKPTPVADLSEYKHYECRVPHRRAPRRPLDDGALDNFVMFIRLPTDAEKAHWTARGVAALQLIGLDVREEELANKALSYVILAHSLAVRNLAQHVGRRHLIVCPARSPARRLDEPGQRRVSHDAMKQRGAHAVGAVGRKVERSGREDAEVARHHARDAHVVIAEQCGLVRPQRPMRRHRGRDARRRRRRAPRAPPPAGASRRGATPISLAPARPWHSSKSGAMSECAQVSDPASPTKALVAASAHSGGGVPTPRAVPLAPLASTSSALHPSSASASAPKTPSAGISTR